MPKKGFRHSLESRQKMSESRKGNVPWNKGRKPTPKELEQLKKQGFQKGHTPWSKGKHLQFNGPHLSEEHKRKIAHALKGNKNGLGHHKSEDVKKKIREHRLKRTYPKKDTDIETLLQKELTKRNIEYQKHTSVCNVCQPDIVFPNQKITVFADGNYWHSKEFKDGSVWKRDRRQEKVLRENGWRVLRFWGSEIRENVSNCVNKIEAVL